MTSSSPSRSAEIQPTAWRFAAAGLGLGLVCLLLLAVQPILGFGAALLAGVVWGWRLAPFSDGGAAAPAGRFEPAGHWLVVALLGINYAWYFVRDAPPWPGLLLLGIAVTGRFLYQRGRLNRPALLLPLLFLLIPAFLGGWLWTPQPAATQPKLFGLFFGVALLFELGHGLRQPHNWRPWLLIFHLLGLGIAGLGLIGISDFPNELFNSDLLERALPRILFDLPRSVSGGFHPNGIAGVLLYFMPLYAVLARGSFYDEWPRRRGWRALSIVTLVFTALVFLFTQSRGAIVALLATIIALQFLFAGRRRLAGLILALTTAAILGAILAPAFPELVDRLGLSEHPAIHILSITVRGGFFRLGLAVLSDNGWYGIGIGALDGVARSGYSDLYPPWLLTTPGAWLPHVHNELLQVAIDTGLFGLIGYVAILAAMLFWLWAVFKRAAPGPRRLAAGIGGGLVAHQLFGLADVIYLGAKPGIALWLLAGFSLALYRQHRHDEGGAVPAAPFAPPTLPPRDLRVSVVIPTWNGRARLARCLKALAAQTEPAGEIIVVDNASTDNTVAYLETAWPHVQVIVLPENRGTAGAHNAGIRQARGDYVVTLNNDAYPDRRWLATLREAMDQAPRYGFATGRLLRADDPERIDAAGDGFHPLQGGIMLGNGRPDGPEFAAEREVFGAGAAAAIYRRALFQTVDLFDETLFMYGDDVDWSVRARLLGYRCLYVPAAIAHHERSGTMGAATPAQTRLIYRNRLTVHLKNMPGPLLWRLSPQLLRTWLAMIRHAPQPAAALRGSLDALWRLPRTWRQRRRIQGRRRLTPAQFEAAMALDAAFFDPPS